jgi:hypothetical protein
MPWQRPRPLVLHILFVGNTKLETGEPEKGTSFRESRLDRALRRATILGSLTMQPKKDSKLQGRLELMQ